MISCSPRRAPLQPPGRLSQSPLAGCLFQFLEKRFALPREPLFKLLSAITVATGPRLCSVFVPARAAGMGVLNAEQLEILFPIWTFLRERWIAKARFNPGGDTLIIYPRLLHVVQVFVACDGTFSKRAIVDCANQIMFLADFTRAFTR